MNKEQSVLLLVDIQPDFMPGGALAVEDGDQILPTVRELMLADRFGLQVATRTGIPPVISRSPAAIAGVNRWRPSNCTVTIKPYGRITVSRALPVRHCTRNCPGKKYRPLSARVWTPKAIPTVAFVITGMPAKSVLGRDWPDTCGNGVLAISMSVVWPVTSV
jgi:hypothetical protein